MASDYTIHWAEDCLTPPPAVEWIIEGLFAKETINCFFGEGGSKKTYSQLDQAICIAAGKDWLDFTTQQANVLFIDEECGEPRMRQRIYAALRGHGLGESIPFAFVSMMGLNLMTPRGLGDLQRVVRDTEAGIVYIDALSDIMAGGDDSTAKDTQVVFKNLKQVVHESHVTLNLVHHTNRVGNFRGSSNIRNQVDTMIAVESKAKSPNMDFKSDKTRDSEPFEFSAVAHFGEDSFHLTSSGEKLKTDDYILQQIKKGRCTLEEWQRNVPATIPPTAVKSALQRLIVAKKVRRSNEGSKGVLARYMIVKGEKYQK